MNVIGLLSLLLLLLQTLGNGVYSQALRYITFVPGIGYFNMRDNGMSAMIYHGTSGSYGMGYNHKAEQFTHLTEIFIYSGKIHSDLTLNRAKNFRSEINYTCAYRILRNWKQKPEIRAGGAINILGAYRNHFSYSNNAMNYDVAASFCPTAQANYNFEFSGKSFSAGGSFYFSLASFVIRASYATSVPAGFIDQKGGNTRAILKSGRVESLLNFFRMASRMHLSYNLTNGNKLMAFYSWDFYSYDRYNSVKAALHGFGISAMFNI